MHLDAVLVFLQPIFHPFCVMDSQIVDDEKEFPFPVVDQADDRDVEVMGELSDDRGLALGGEASAYMGFRLCRSLVCPPNLCVFRLRACF